MATKRVKKSKFKAKKIGRSGEIILSFLLLSAIIITLTYINNETTPKTKLADKVETVSNSDYQEPATEKSTIKSSESNSSNKINTTTQKRSTPKGLQNPKYEDSNYILYSTEGRYTCYYSPEHKQPLWVGYILTQKDMSEKNAKRKDDFRPNLIVESRGWKAAQLSDYKGSGYDRGHLVPSADRDNSAQENSATFLLTNIAPQASRLNRFTWSALESEVRRIATKYDSVYITTAGVLNNPTGRPMKHIGDGVTIPEQFYKAILLKDRETYHAIGFLFPNKNDVDKDFTKYVVTIDSLESVTGLDLYHSLDDHIEHKIESEIDLKFWNL